MSQPVLGPLGFLAACLAWLRPYRTQCVLAGVTLLPAVAFCTLQPLLLRALVDDAVIPRDAQRATRLVAAQAVLLALDAVMELASHYLSARVGARVSNDLRARMLEHFQRLSLSFYDRAQLGSLLTRFTSDLDAIERVLTRDLRAATVNALTIVVGLGVLFVVEWRLALLTLVFLPGIYLGPRLFSRRADMASYERQEEGARLAASVQENLSAQVVIKAFALQPLALGRLRDHLGRVASRSDRVGLLAGLQAATISATGSSLLVVTIGAGTFMAIRGELSVGSLVAFFELIWWMVSAVQRLSDVVLPFQQAAGGAQRITELLAERPDVVDAPDAVAVPTFARELRFEDVRFSYDGERPNIAGVTLAIPAGHSVALVGPSGCGKSTLLALMLRFRDPDEGRVTIDGVDLRTVAQASLLAQMGSVFQDTSCSTRRSARTSVWAARRPVTARWRPPPATPRSTSSSCRCRRATTPRSASGARDCPAASASGSRWRGRCCATRGSCCSTRPPPPATPRRRRPSTPRSSAWAGIARWCP